MKSAHSRFWQTAGYDYYPVSLSIIEPGRSVGGTTGESYSVYAETYTEQVFKILDRDKTEVVFNGEWFHKMTFSKSSNPSP